MHYTTWNGVMDVVKNIKSGWVYVIFLKFVKKYLWSISRRSLPNSGQTLKDTQLRVPPWFLASCILYQVFLTSGGRCGERYFAVSDSWELYYFYEAKFWKALECKLTVRYICSSSVSSSARNCVNSATARTSRFLWVQERRLPCTFIGEGEGSNTSGTPVALHQTTRRNILEQSLLHVHF
jgi:hypothetical protein